MQPLLKEDPRTMPPAMPGRDPLLDVKAVIGVFPLTDRPRMAEGIVAIRLVLGVQPIIKPCVGACTPDAFVAMEKLAPIG